jgi:hypothetical protein
MPLISWFFGISIRMFYRDHAPPHFHVVYGEYEAAIALDTLEVISGKLPKRVLGLALEWAAQHRQELKENWTLCATSQQPITIPPLD